MKMSVVAAMKQLAAKNFKFKDVSFVDFDSIDAEDLNAAITDAGLQESVASIEASANLKLGYEGEPPDSYRVLNGMLQDWVDDHDEDLKKVINPKLMSYLKEHYEGADLSDLKEDFDDFIWEDQVDYMPEIDEDKKEIKFTVDLVLEVEDVIDDDD
jgi:hypothetical protein